MITAALKQVRIDSIIRHLWIRGTCEVITGAVHYLRSVTKARARRPAFPMTISNQPGGELTLSVPHSFIFKKALHLTMLLRLTQLPIDKSSQNVPFFTLFWPPRF